MQEANSTTEGHDEHLIQGSMTLSEVEEISNVPVEYLIERLQLPADVSTAVNLGQLKKQYDFEMEDVRSVVEEYNAKDPLMEQ